VLPGKSAGLAGGGRAIFESSRLTSIGTAGRLRSEQVADIKSECPADIIGMRNIDVVRMRCRRLPTEPDQSVLSRAGPIINESQGIATRIANRMKVALSRPAIASSNRACARRRSVLRPYTRRRQNSFVRPQASHVGLFSLARALRWGDPRRQITGNSRMSAQYAYQG
jgi:hypothetical protein